MKLGCNHPYLIDGYCPECGEQVAEMMPSFDEPDNTKPQTPAAEPARVGDGLEEEIDEILNSSLFVGTETKDDTIYTVVGGKVKARIALLALYKSFAEAAVGPDQAEGLPEMQEWVDMAEIGNEVRAEQRTNINRQCGTGGERGGGE